jgi:hypothetical protein
MIHNFQSPTKEKDVFDPILPIPKINKSPQIPETQNPLVVKRSKRSPIVLKPFATFDSIEISVKSLNQLSLKEQVPLAVPFL